MKNVIYAYPDLSKISILLSDNYILVFNATQTPFPIFDKYIDGFLWPQTKLYGTTAVCQPSGPIANNSSFIWNLSELNMNFEVIPFTNCQGIPIVITSVKSSKLASSAFTIINNKIVVDSGYGYLNTLRSLDASNLATKGNHNDFTKFSNHKWDSSNWCWGRNKHNNSYNVSSYNLNLYPKLRPNIRKRSWSYKS